MLDSLFASEIVYTHQWNQQKFHIWTWKSLRKEGISFCVHIDNCHWLTGTGRYKHMRGDFVHFLPFFPFSDSVSLKPASSLVFLRTVSRDFLLQSSNYPTICHLSFHTLSVHLSTYLFIQVPIYTSIMYIYTCTYLHVPSGTYSPTHHSYIYICIYHLHPKLLAWNHPIDGIS